MTQQDILDAIHSGELDGDLDTLLNAVTTATYHRFKVRDQAPMAIGSRVYLNGFCARKSSQGSVATIVRVNRTRVVIELDEPEYRNGRPVTQVTCPLSILSPLPEDAEIVAGIYRPSLAA